MQLPKVYILATRRSSINWAIIINPAALPNRPGKCVSSELKNHFFSAVCQNPRECEVFDPGERGNNCSQRLRRDLSRPGKNNSVNVTREKTEGEALNIDCRTQKTK